MTGVQTCALPISKNIVLYIGKKDSDEKNYYVQLKGSHMVYLSDKDVVKNILN